MAHVPTSVTQNQEANSEHSNGHSGKASNIVSFRPQLMLPASKADEAVRFYKEAFGADELMRVNHPKRKADQNHPLIVFSELKIGTTSLLVCDKIDDVDAAEGDSSGIIFMLETRDVADVVAKAVKAGAVADGEITKVEGVRGGLLGKVKDPFGVVWIIASYVEKSCETESQKI